MKGFGKKGGVAQEEARRANMEVTRIWKRQDGRKRERTDRAAIGRVPRVLPSLQKTETLHPPPQAEARGDEQEKLGMKPYRQQREHSVTTLMQLLPSLWILELPTK